MKNENNIDLEISFLIHSGLLTTDNNQVSGYYRNNTLIQYMHDYTVTILATEHKLSVIPKEMVEVQTVGGTELYRVVTVDTNNNITVQISTTDGNQPDEAVKITIFGWN